MVRRGDSVTVASLCREADINRTTFYGHYDSLDDFRATLELALSDDLVRMVRQILQSNTASEARKTVLALGHHYDSNVALYLAVTGSNPGRNAMAFRQEAIVSDGEPTLDDAMRADLVLSSVASIFHGWAVGFYGDAPVDEVSERVAAFVIGALELSD